MNKIRKIVWTITALLVVITISIYVYIGYLGNEKESLEQEINELYEELYQEIEPPTPPDTMG